MRRRVLGLGGALLLGGCAAWSEPAPRVVVKTVTKVVERPVVVERIVVRPVPTPVGACREDCCKDSKPCPALPMITKVTPEMFQFCREKALMHQCDAEPLCTWVPGFGLVLVHEKDVRRDAQRTCIPKDLAKLPVLVVEHGTEGASPVRTPEPPRPAPAPAPARARP